MKICIIAEGSYPYITGGVSSWIHGLVTEMAEHEFIIYAIGAQSKYRGKFKYKLPGNIVEVREIFLDAYLDESGEWGRRFRLSAQQRDDLKSLIGGKAKPDWDRLFRLIRSPQFRRTADFLSSKDYFDIVEDICRTDYELVPFTEMFWTIRSMILPLFLTIREDLPEADLYHSVSTGYAGIVGALAKHLYGSPLILTEHGIYSREREEEIIKADWVKGYFKDLWIKYFYRLSGCIYEAADEVITLFHRNREIQTELGCESSKIRIIPNGVHAEGIYGGVRDPEDHKIMIGAVVRIVPIKDIKTMLQSFALVKREVPEAVFTIMGPTEEDESYYRECLQMVESLQLKDVVFTGEVQVKDYLGRMDMMVLSSISEGQPLAVLEGMACGKPFVSTNVGSCRELLYGRDDGIGPAGFVVPVMNYELMAQRIIELCKDRELREEMGRNALQRVKLHYQHHDFIDSYRRLYASLEGVRHGGNRI
ncbi:GT4 family glycosyltransferase PelF [Paenibacillus sp. M1]|uniref:GT4 family glycosyltransferase PelF n=1 Tax=Paenibacillus haidiansis TaxID=1574488 RepID=A0ABU7VUB5_9BACL